MRGNQPSVEDKKLIAEFAADCLLMRTRLISRVLTGIYDQALREFGLTSPQFALLVVISRMGSASRAEIGRYHHQDRSTLTRNLKIMISEGWIMENPESPGGRARPMMLTDAGVDLLSKVAPVWRTSQLQAKALLGDDNVAAIADMAARIMKTKATA